jgi:hypothetical protein
VAPPQVCDVQNKHDVELVASGAPMRSRSLTGLPTALLLAPRKVARLLRPSGDPPQERGAVLVGSPVAQDWPKNEKRGALGLSSPRGSSGLRGRD